MIPVASFSGNVRFFVYYRGIYQRQDPFGRLIILGGTSTSAWVWQVAYGTATYTPCICNSWTGGSCGAGGCGFLQRQQNRTCNPAGCSTTSQCVNDATCCSCGAWTNGSCGAGGCAATQRQQTRTCNPANCQSQSQCVADAACGNVTISGRVANNSGTGLPGVVIDTCGASVTTDSNGNWSRTVPSGTSYCARVSSGLPAGYSAIKGTSNNSCNTNASTYEYQIAGQNQYVNCGYADQRSWDLANDSNINFVVDYPPACSCNSWTSGSCAAGGCTATQRQQTRTCNPANCLAQSQCLADATCTSCSCGAFSNAGCAQGGCSVGQMWQTRSCNPANCQAETKCVADVDCTCSCDPWTGGSCGAGGCGVLQRQQTRTCNPAACSTTSQCVNDATCCSCGSWTDDDCGLGGCASDKMRQIRICNPAGCETESKCSVSASCPRSLNVTLVANPNFGSAPLAAVLTATVSGTATGTINYTTWWNCNNACATVAACQTACGAWDDKADGVVTPTRNLNHTYTAIGTYTPKIIVERASLIVEDNNTVTVSSGGGPTSLSAEIVAAPSSGAVPLNTTLTMTVSGTATGTINYTTWWNCNNTCATVAGCQTACGSWDDKADGLAVTNKVLNHTYASAGTFTPKVIVERASLIADDDDTVTVVVGNNPPTADTLTKQNDFCASGLATMFSWNYTDPENDPQTFRQVQVDNDSDFSSPADDSGKVASISNSYVTLASKLAYDTTYRWRLKVWDNKGNESDWISGSDFSMPLHSYPLIAFSWSPAEPKENDEVTYTDQTQVFGGATVSARSWVIEAATPNTSVAAQVKAVYETKGTYKTTLTITDSNGYTCSLEKSVKVKSRIPDWEEL